MYTSEQRVVARQPAAAHDEPSAVLPGIRAMVLVVVQDLARTVALYILGAAHGVYGSRARGGPAPLLLAVVASGGGGQRQAAVRGGGAAARGRRSGGRPVTPGVRLLQASASAVWPGGPDRQRCRRGAAQHGRQMGDGLSRSPPRA